MFDSVTRSQPFAGVLLLLVAACAGPQLAVDEVLAAEAGSELEAAADANGTAATSRSRILAVVDAAAIAARERAASAETSQQQLVDAARALFLAADARLQLATLEEAPTASLDELLFADDRASTDVRAEVESLSRDGRRFARRALDQDPANPAASLYYASNTCLLAWSVGTRRALFDGLGTQCDAATRAAVAADEALADAAPLRLRGRFLSRAPWPVGDAEEGLRLLRRAVELAPVRLNYLFLGDSLHATGDEAGARDAWTRALEARPDTTSSALAEVRREQAARRLAAAKASEGPLSREERRSAALENAVALRGVETPGNGGSEGGTRTRDTRLMKPVL